MKQKNTPLVPAIFFAVVTIACLFNSPPAMAGTRIWNGGGTPDGNWGNPGNWNGVTPATNDLLIFSGSTQTATTNNFSADMPFGNISFSGGAGAFTLNGNELTLASPADAGSGNIQNGNIINSASGTEIIKAPVVMASGYHTIGSASGTLKLNGTVTHNNGAVAAMSGNINVTGGLSTNGSANGILGGWAIYNNNWATIDASSNVVAYSGYTDISGGTILPDNASSNVRITASAGVVTVLGVTHANSIYIKSGSAAQMLSVPASATLVLGQNGGIYNSSATTLGGAYNVLTVGTNTAPGSGILTAGDGINPAQITLGSDQLPNANGFITINASIQDNNLLGNHAPVTVTLAGAYDSMNGVTTTSAQNMSTNTYSGGTYILYGRVSQPNPFTFGTGPVHIVSGGQANIGCNVTNDFYIEGSGTVEQNGMGAIRLYGAGGTYGFVGNLSGTIHLTGTAAIGENNNANPGSFIGISGKITGPGGLMISSPTATRSGAGTVNIGSTNGTFDIPNDYAGDTSINGIAGTGGGGSALLTALKICNSADNNIMPHGKTGNFQGGPTGNLILNANFISPNNLVAQFDLNGSTQTINGLSSSSRNPSNNIVTDSSGLGANLILGDSDATSTFAGAVQNTVALTKIGNGTITLSGPNTYTADTVVKAGRLVTTTASTGGGNFSVSNSAALGVTLAASGATLQMNGLTLASGSSLQLNAGSFGSPATAIANVNGALNITGTVNISLSGIGLTAGGPFPILTYNAGLRTGGGSFQLVTSPRIVATLNDNNAGLVTVTITSADSGIKWEGGALGNWDINDTGNSVWQTVPSANTAYYIESGSGNDSVFFDDTATGNTNVTVTTAVTPQSLAVTNSADTYTFAGPGKITGTTGLVKAGTGSLIIANTGNDFSGAINLANGTLVISNDWNLGNTITGTGALVKSGSGTLTMGGDGSLYTGPVTINGGVLSVQNSVTLATASSMAITNGGVLDIANNNVALGNLPITVSGSGIGGNGAIVNSGGYAGGAIATSFQNLTLAGNTTIGGPGRLDLANGTLSSGGLPYKLTKVSVSQLRLADSTIDSALGDIEVQGGTLILGGALTSLGNNSSNIIVDNGAILQLITLGSDITKPITVQDSGVVNNNTGGNALDGAVTLQGNSLFNIGGTQLTINGVVQGGGALNKITGTAPLNLANANTYSGGTIVNAGVINFNADNNLGAAPGSATPGNVVLNGGGISAQIDLTLNANRGVAVGPASGTGSGFIDVASTMIYNGIIANNGSGTGTLVKTNNGALFLGGASTYTGNTIIAGGVLALTNSGTINSSANIILLNSTTLDVSGHTGGSYTLAPGQTLTGSTYGTVNGNLTNGPGSTINPGTNAQGTYTIQGALVIQGTNLMDINKDQTYWDSINATSIKFGGTLMLNLSNAVNPFVAGDAFPIYSASSYSGAFASIIPATPGAGLAWDTSTLTNDGTLRIMVGPTLPTTNANITSVTLSGTNVIVTGTNNNVPNTSFHYAVLTSTNLTLPLSNWTPVVTNSFNPDGTFNYTNPIVPGTPRQFIDVQAVP